MNLSQHQKILNILSDRKWHCTNEMYASYIADPRTRITELKKKGYILLWQWCKTHPHNKSKEWQLLGNTKLQIGANRGQVEGEKSFLGVSQPPLMAVPNTFIKLN